MPRVYKAEDKGYNPDIKPGMSAEEVNGKLANFVSKAMEWGDRIPIGVFMKNETTSSYDERILERIPFYMQVPPAKRVIADEANHSSADLTPLFNELKVR